MYIGKLFAAQILANTFLVILFSLYEVSIGQSLLGRSRKSMKCLVINVNGYLCVVRVLQLNDYETVTIHPTDGKEETNKNDHNDLDVDMIFILT